MHVLRLELTGGTIGCSLSKVVVNTTTTTIEEEEELLSHITHDDSLYTSGGLAFMPYDGVSGHHFKSFAVTNQAPSPQPTAPTMTPSVSFQECSVSSCGELGWPLKQPGDKVCGESDKAPLLGCSGEVGVVVFRFSVLFGSSPW